MPSSPGSAGGPGRTAHAARLGPDQLVPLGRTGIEVSRLGLGTAFLDKAGRDEDAVAVVAAALDAGIRYIDTAPLYGLGYAERIVGYALADRPRQDVVLSTKVGRMLQRGQKAQPA